MANKTDKEIEKEFSSKKVVRTQKWTFEVNTFEDGSLLISRENEGFNTIELLGYIYKAQQEILQQISGEIKPTKNF
jgi:hypothetical protein